jgi:hypothetical protein
MVYFSSAHKNIIAFTSHASQYLQNVQQFFYQIQPFASETKQPCLLTWRASFFLVVTNAHPPLTLVCQQLSDLLAFTPLNLSHPTVQITLFT